MPRKEKNESNFFWQYFLLNKTLYEQNKQNVKKSNLN